MSSGQKPSNTLNSSRVAQSQPGSRSASPTPKYSYLTHNANSNNINNISGFGLLMASPNSILLFFLVFLTIKLRHLVDLINIDVILES